MKLLQEFKTFAIKGNAIDMAVGIIIGAAFGKIITSIVSDIIMPPIGLLLGNVDFSSLFIALDGKTYSSLSALEASGAPALKIGVFMNDLISFLILGSVMFMLVKAYTKISKKENAPVAAPTTKSCPTCAMEIPLAAKKCPYCQQIQ